MAKHTHLLGKSLSQNGLSQNGYGGGQVGIILPDSIITIILFEGDRKQRRMTAQRTTKTTHQTTKMTRHKQKRYHLHISPKSQANQSLISDETSGAQVYKYIYIYIIYKYLYIYICIWRLPDTPDRLYKLFASVQFPLSVYLVLSISSDFEDMPGSGNGPFYWCQYCQIRYRFWYHFRQPFTFRHLSHQQPTI